MRVGAGEVLRQATRARWRRGETAILACVAAAVFLGCMLFRSPGVLLAPRFWAEEGYAYYQVMLHVPWWDSLVLVNSGNYQLLTNLICLLSAHVPDRYAAFPTTYAAAVLDIYCCFLLAEALRSRGASLATVAGAIALFSLQNAGYEVFLNTTNVMWVCSAGTLFIALGHERAPGSGRAWLAYASVAVFGLTGVTSVALAPAYAVQLLRKRSAYRGALLAVLGLAGAIQAAVVLGQGPDSGRSMRLTLQAVVPLVLETELASVLPADALDAVGAKIVPYDAAATGMAIQVSLVGAALLVLFASLAARAATAADALLIAGALLWITLFNEYGGIGDPLAWHSGWGGGRYFFLGATAFIVLVSLSRVAGPPLGRGIATCAMALIASNAVVQSFGAPWIPLFVAGPSVSSQVKACAGRRPCRISYPPHGPGAEFMLDHTYDPGFQLPGGGN